MQVFSQPTEPLDEIGQYRPPGEKQTVPRAEAMAILAFIHAISAVGLTGVKVRVYADAKATLSA